MSPPAWLTAEGRDEWERIVPQLERLGLLAIIVVLTLAAVGCAARHPLVFWGQQLSESASQLCY